jgi:hypothetical protein
VFTLLAGLVLHAAAPIGFEQVQRINQLTLQSGVDTFATANRFGAAISGAAARSQLQQSINSAIADGSSSTFLTFPGLVDLTGTNAPSLSLGVESGSPFILAGNPTNYSAASDLDWWYLLDPLTLDAGGNAIDVMTGGITNQVLSVGPGPFVFANLPLVNSSGAALALSSAFVKAMTSTSSIPLRSTNNFPPGHRPGEQINPALISFTTITNGQLKGNISALALANTPIPSGFAGGGVTACSQGYTAQNSFLDLVVGGCTVLFTTQITSSQPDQFDTNAPVAGAGPPYTFQTDASHHVATARDRSNAVVNLQTALAASSYSAYFKFATVRVIAHTAPSPSLQIGGLFKLSNGAFHLAFTNAPRATFTVLASSTNLSGWTPLSDPTQTMSGVFEFADPAATNLPRRFYRVRSP